MTEPYDYDTLKEVMNDVGADRKTRDVAKALARTSLKSAIRYVEGYPLRVASEREAKKSYENP